MTQEEYIDYLRYVYVKADGNKLADSSVIHYGVNAINSINERLQSIFGPEFSIYEIDDIEVLSSIRKKLFSEPDFVTSNKKGNLRQRFIFRPEGRECLKVLNRSCRNERV
ncbi:MAG: hypothetical protein PHI83_03155, partial [Sphaerochaetaceae bacterium]|nr:hypothetical protein [Sphaerochaetaceae bacterium]